MKKIMTGNYDNCKTGNLVSISGDKGKAVSYEGIYMVGLAPKKSFWNIWHNNIGKIPEQENIRYYVKKYYEEVLSKYDPLQLYNLLENETILLCYESNEDFCHRHLSAFYLELFLGIHTSEVRVNSKRQTYHVLARPEYLKVILEEVIKETYEMNGYNSLRAAYLYNIYKQIIKEEVYRNSFNLDNEELALQYRQEAEKEEKKYIMSMK